MNFELFTKIDSLKKNYSSLIPEPKLLENDNKELNLEYINEESEFKNEYCMIKEKFVDKPQKKIENIVNIPNFLQNKQVLLLLKPARKPTTSFITYFPRKIYCSPYKYDIYVKISEELDQNYDIKFNFIDSEDGTKILTNSKNKDSIIYGKTKKNKISGFIEYNFRVCFTVCSFHHFKRAFIFIAELKKKNNENEILTFFKSNPFTTFARKNENDLDAWNDDESEVEEYKDKEIEGKKRKFDLQGNEKNKKIKQDFTQIKTEDIKKMMNENNNNQISSIMQDFDFLLN
jgi:hypothetical protein